MAMSVGANGMVGPAIGRAWVVGNFSQQLYRARFNGLNTADDAVGGRPDCQREDADHHQRLEEPSQCPVQSRHQGHRVSQ